MVRTSTPFVERMTFFWHRHFANSRDAVSPPQLLLQQNDLFQKYSDFATNAKVTFSDLAHEVTINPSMLRYLTGEENVKGAPNENYARELMELFALGVFDANGNKNYSQDDVNGLAKAFSGWVIDDSNPATAKGVFQRAAGTTARRSCSGSSRTSTRRAASTSCSATRTTRRS